MAKKNAELTPEQEQAQAVEQAEKALADLGWDGPYETPGIPGTEQAPSFRAERPGTHPHEVASSTLDGLVASAQAKEAALAESEAQITPVE